MLVPVRAKSAYIEKSIDLRIFGERLLRRLVPFENEANHFDLLFQKSRTDLVDRHKNDVGGKKIVQTGIALFAIHTDVRFQKIL